MQGRADAVDGLPTWVRWIIVGAVGLSPILTFWLAGVLGRFMRRKLWPRAPGRAPRSLPIGRDRPASQSAAELTPLPNSDVSQAPKHRQGDKVAPDGVLTAAVLDSRGQCQRTVGP